MKNDMHEVDYAIWEYRHRQKMRKRDAPIFWAAIFVFITAVGFVLVHTHV